VYIYAGEGIVFMKFIVNILLCVGCCSAFLFSKEVDGNKKSLKGDSAITMGTLKLSHGYGEMTAGDDVIERKRSHKRRRVVRKPRKGRSK
jgi:hypothetical protein